jgi:hypothetical protein
MERGVDVRAEDAVEVPRREAVLGELELQRGDVPARVPEVEVPAAEAVPGEAAERAACLRAHDAVDLDPRTGLEFADRLLRCRAGDAVDRPLVEPARVQPDLQRGDARIGRRSLGDEGCGDEDDGQREERPVAHGMSLFAVAFPIP